MHNGAFDWEKCTEYPQNDIDGFKVKTYVNVYYINPRDLNFNPSELRPFFSEKCTE